MKVGVWMVGGRGSVAAATVAGAAAVGAGLVPPVGMVTQLPVFDRVPLPPVDALVFGGHDLVQTPLGKRVEALAGAGIVPLALVGAVAGALEAADEAIRPGVAAGGGEPPAEAVRRLQHDFSEFVARHRLDGMVVVNCASTEGPAAAHPAHDRLDALEEELAAGASILPPSALAAFAAMDAGWPFVDFTPSTGARLPALDELALRRGAPHAGRDGKTGETLVKAALAAMFADRHLAVRSWSGMNVLGGGDGATLAGSGPAASKLRTKTGVVPGILGTGVESHVHIGHVADLGEWKTAWDLISFEGFLGTRMRLQFTWEGADSALAAPLVLDLARLAHAAHRAGQAGALAALAFFFKDPVGTSEHRLDRQFADLTAWAAALAPETAARPERQE